MSDLVNTALTATPLQPWRQLDSSSWTRQCFSAESFFSLFEVVADGTGQMPVFVTFDTNIVEAELVERVRNAWLSCHASMPHVAVAISDPNHEAEVSEVSSMTYTMLRSEADAQEWLQDTFSVVRDKSAADLQHALCQKPLATRGRRSKLYLVVASKTDSGNASHYALLWHSSHVIIDAFSRQQLFDKLFRKVVAGRSGKPSMDSLDYSNVFDRLPVPIASAYEAQLKPTEEQRQQGLKEILTSSHLARSKMPEAIHLPFEQYGGDKGEATCWRLELSVQQTQDLLDEFRRENLSITYAVSAAATLAIQQLYGRNGNAGATLAISRHARRWIDTSLAPLAIDSVPLWVPFAQHWLQGEPTREVVLEVGRRIKTELQPYLESPHYIAAIDYVVKPRLAAMMAAPRDNRTAASFSVSVSSQGIIHMEPEFRSREHVIKTHGYHIAGRSTGANPWISINTFRGQLRLRCDYHTSVFARNLMEKYAAQIKLNLDSICSSLGRQTVGGV
ncbi:uncharacterized protein TrAtP1_011899 [Trichoderma atroviride]|uniref:uncharacterized protein n=1 Tax=Hypocrea atroviridis TaxID=63577 RepID=UPI0033245D85|nr:hypothetical protein TrAtP1_011899 [Trichoderma atroviride]